MNQDDYNFGLTRDKPGGKDQRSEFRLTGRATVKLQLEAPDWELDEPGKSVVCHTHDLSSSGVRIQTQERLPVSALLPMVVALDGDHSEYLLTGEVVWAEHQPDGFWTVGLRILDSDETSFVDWVDAVSRAMTQD